MGHGSKKINKHLGDDSLLEKRGQSLEKNSIFCSDLEKYGQNCCHRQSSLLSIVAHVIVQKPEKKTRRFLLLPFLSPENRCRYMSPALIGGRNRALIGGRKAVLAV